MKFIPPAKDCAPVGVGLALHDGVMNSVHAWSYNDRVQDTLETDGQSPVRMMKECCHFEAKEKNEQHDRRDPESDDGQCEESNGKNHFAEMKSSCRAHIEVEVGMVHIVEPPKERDHVVGPMPPPIGVVHEQKGCDCASPCRQRQPVHETYVSVLRPNRDRDRNRQHREAHDQESRNGQNPVTDQSPEGAEMLAAQRKTPLQPEQNNKNPCQQQTSPIVEEREFGHCLEREKMIAERMYTGKPTGERLSNLNSRRWHLAADLRALKALQATPDQLTAMKVEG